MCITGKWEIGMLMIAMVLACETANAQHWRQHHHYNYHPNREVTVVVRPKATSQTCNRFSQKERFAMAVAYLETHDFLTVRQYANMTQLSKTSAEAELDAFAMDKKKSIQPVIRGKKKIYVKNG